MPADRGLLVLSVSDSQQQHRPSRQRRKYSVITGERDLLLHTGLSLRVPSPPSRVTAAQPTALRGDETSCSDTEPQCTRTCQRTLQCPQTPGVPREGGGPWSARDDRKAGAGADGPKGRQTQGTRFPLSQKRVYLPETRDANMRTGDVLPRW